MTNRLDSTLRFLRITVDQTRFLSSTDDQLLVLFHKKRDELAFEEIVRRHGPMVLAICRRVLGATPDVDDAFQATFLVLIRKAGSIRSRNLLANWLCGVAYKVTRKAQQRRWKLLAREQQVDAMPEPAYEADPPHDWLPFFDDALLRLPEKYRSALVLCDLQGQSRIDAAKRLGLSENTLSSRLARAREMLRAKLQRFGFPLSFMAAVAPASIGQSLWAATIQSSRAIVYSGPILSLAKGVITSMFVSKLKTGVVWLVLLATVGLMGSQIGKPNQADAQSQEQKKDAERKIPADSLPETPKTVFQADQKKVVMEAEDDELNGDWKAVSAEQSGFDATEEIIEGKVEDLSIQFTDPTGMGGKLTWGCKGKPRAFNIAEPIRFVVNRSKSPREITFLDTNQNRIKYMGIYRQQGDSLMICITPGDDPPKAFRTEPGSPEILYRYERVKKSASAALDKHKFQGSWKAVSAMRDGIDYIGTMKNYHWFFDEKTLTISSMDPGQTNVAHGRWAINAHVPQRMIMFPNYCLSQRENYLRMDCIGIYEFDKDRVKIAFRPMEGKTKPPSTFSGDNGDGAGLIVLERMETPIPKDPRSKEEPKLAIPPDFSAEQKKDTINLPAAYSAAQPPVTAPSPVMPPSNVDDLSALREVQPPVSPPGSPTAAPKPGLEPMTVQQLPLPVPAPMAGQPIGPAPVPVQQETSIPAIAQIPANVPLIAEQSQRTQALPPPTQEEKKLDDLSLLQGKWAFVEAGGAESEMTMEIVRDVMLCDDGHAERIHLDSTASPKRIDLALIQGKDGKPEIRYGIYKIEGNRLFICLHKAKTPRLRPAEFANDAEAMIDLFAYQRPAPRSDKPPPTPPPSQPPTTKPAPSNGATLSPPVLHVPLQPMTIPYVIQANGEKVHGLKLYLSRNHGQKWELEAVTPKKPITANGEFKFTPKEAGSYWFALGIVREDGKETKYDELEPLLRIIVDPVLGTEVRPEKKPNSEEEKLRTEVRDLRKRLEELEKNVGTKK